MFKKLLSTFNIHPDSNQKYLLISLVISGLLITYSHPTLVKVIVSELPAQWIAFESLSMSISGLVIGIIWKGKLRERAMRYFYYLALTESICGCMLGFYLCFISFNVWLFAIASLIYSSLISTFVGKCIMAFKAKLWIEKNREVYDNNASIVSGIVCIIGYLFAIVALPSLKLALFLWSICCIFDDIGWIIVYRLNKERLTC